MKLEAGKFYLHADGTVVKTLKSVKGLNMAAFLKGSDNGYYNAETGKDDWDEDGLVKEVEADSMKVKSLDRLAIWHEDTLHVGCQQINHKDALKLFKWLGKHLGYEVQ